MARGDGITRIVGPDGKPRYRARASVVDPRTGKRSQPQATHDTLKAARAWKAETEAGAARGTYQARSAATLGAVVADWLTLEAAHAVGATTLETYQDVARLHIVPALGSVPVQRLTTERIERHYAEMLARAYAPASVTLVHCVLRQVLERAVRHRLIIANPAAVRMKVLGRRGRRPAGAPPVWQTWTRQECRAFLAVVPGSKYGPLFAVLLQTGMRRGEALGLRWSDVTPPTPPAGTGWLRVERALEPVGDGRVAALGDTKDHERRHVPLLPSLAAALDNWRATLGPQATRPTSYIFPGPHGDGFLDPDNVGYDFGRLTRLAELPRIRLHDLRHTFSTLCLQEGVPIHVVSQWLGHADITTTLRVYSHVTAVLEERGVEYLQRVFSDPLEGESEAPSAPGVRIAL